MDIIENSQHHSKLEHQVGIRHSLKPLKYKKERLEVELD